jgi:serine/threonine-protein kinase
MISTGSRESGLEIPFLEMEPVFAQDSQPDLGTLETGSLIAERYRVLRQIGAGGMGVLYACEDSVLARQVAVKLMQRSIAADPLLCERLLREARLAAQLRRHVAQVFDCGTLATGEPYIVMELLRGRDLHSVLKQSGPLAPGQLIAYVLELCVGLAEAHGKGIIHRDLKPENLYLASEPDGTTVLKIVDFGVSKQLSSRDFRSQTNPTESVGSPQYMSPEQITTPGQVDPRTDIWSLGVVMFELLTGNVPFNGAGPAQVCAAVLTQPIPAMSNYRKDVPPALEAIVLRCLERDRERRFDHVADLAAALGAFSADDEPLAPDRSSSSPIPARARARRWLGVLCAVTVIAACAGVLVLAVREGRIRVPMGLDVSRLPASISAWHLPFLSPTPGSESAPHAQLGPASSPLVPMEQRPLAPAAAAAPAMAAAPAAAAPAMATASVPGAPAVAAAPAAAAPVATVRPLAKVQVRTPAHVVGHANHEQPSAASPFPTPTAPREPSGSGSSPAAAETAPPASASDTSSNGSDDSSAR